MIAQAMHAGRYARRARATILKPVQRIEVARDQDKTVVLVPA
jgi:hypothetical protein